MASVIATKAPTTASTTTAEDTLKRKTRDANVVSGGHLVAKALKADAVIFVDDVVAGPQVGEALERSPDANVGARRTLAEDLRVGQEHKAEVTEDEATARRCDREQQCGLLRKIVPRLENHGVDSTEESLRAQRLSAVGERDHDSVASAHERGEVALGFGKPARRNSGPLRLEGVRLPGWEL